MIGIVRTSTKITDACRNSMISVVQTTPPANVDTKNVLAAHQRHVTTELTVFRTEIKTCPDSLSSKVLIDLQRKATI